MLISVVGVWESIVENEIARGEPRVYDEQADSLVEIFAAQGKLGEDELKKLESSIQYFKMCMFSCSGWGDEELLKSVKNFVESLNAAHLRSDQNLIKGSVARSVDNFIRNCLDAGQYSLDDDPTEKWRQW